MANPQLLIKVIADTAAAKRDLDSLTSTIEDFGRKAAAAFAVASAAAAAGLASAVGSASDLNEAINASRQLFGNAAKGIEAWADTADVALGMSKKTALDAAVQFGLFGKEAGLTGDELVKFSTTLVSLGADLASFGNTTPERALEALGSALAGQIRPLRYYAVLLSAAAVEQEALAMGIFSGKGELTAQQKTLATYSLIMKKTTVQQGDFARTSMDMAQQQRILRAQIENASAALGAIFLPAATTVMRFLNSTFLPMIDRATIGLKVFFAALTGQDLDPAVAEEWAGPFLDAARKLHDFFVDRLLPAIRLVTAFLSENKEVFLAVAGAFSAIAVSVSAAAAAFYLFRKFRLILTILFNPLTLALVGLATALGLAWKNSERFRTAVVKSFNAVKDAVRPLVTELQYLFGLFTGRLAGVAGNVTDWRTTVVDALIAVVKIWEKVSVALSKVALWGLEKLLILVLWLNDMFTIAKDKVTDFARTHERELAKVAGWAGAVWDGFIRIKDAIGQLVGGAAGKFVQWLRDNRDAIGELAGKIATFLGEAKDNLLAWFRDHKDEMIKLRDAVLDFGGKAFEKLKEVVTYVVNNKDIFGQWLAGVVAFYGALKIAIGLQVLLNIITGLNPWVLLAGAIALLVLAIMIAWRESEKFREVVTKVFNYLRDEVKPIIDGVIEGLRNLWNDSKQEREEFIAAITKLWEEVKKLWQNFEQLAPWLILVAIGFGLIFAPLWTVIVLVIVAYGKFETFRNVVNFVLRFVLWLLTIFVDQMTRWLQVIQWALGMAQWEWEQLQKGLDGTINLIKSIISGMWDGVLSGFQWIKDKVVGLWDELWKFVEGVVKDIQGAVKSITDPLNTLKEFFRIGGNSVIAPSMVIAPVAAPVAATRAAPAAPRSIVVNVSHAGLAIDSPRLQREIVGALRRWEQRNGPLGGVA